MEFFRVYELNTGGTRTIEAEFDTKAEAKSYIKSLVGDLEYEIVKIYRHGV